MTVPKLNHTWERFFGQRIHCFRQSSRVTSYQAEVKLSWLHICPIHDVRTVLYGWKADLCKNKNGVSKIRNKIKSIKGKKKKMEHRNKNWRWNGKPTTLKKGKTNRQQQQQKIQNTHTQNAEYNAYHVCNYASTNFQSLFFQRINQFSKIIRKSSPIVFRFPFLFSNNACVPVPSYNNIIHISVLFNVPFAVKRN